MPLTPTTRRGLSGLLAVCLLLPGLCSAAHCDYAIVVSRSTRADPAWSHVVAALQAKHAPRGVVVVEHEGDLDGIAKTLRQHMPAYTCFVAQPAEANRTFVASVHQLTRGLDDDPYTDTLWGILTGFDAANALAIASHTEPLMIETVTSGTEIAMDRVVEGAWFSELTQHLMVVKQRAEEAQEAVAEADTTAAIAKRLAEGHTDLFITSGHATERGWQIGFGFRNGSFRSAGGQLFGVDTAGNRFGIHSNNPKVWLPIGNCLAGHIDGPDALALAFLNAAGVQQMIGYTVPTWFGYAGWGCLDYFVEQPGRYTLTEAFHANAHALIHRIETLRHSEPRSGDLRGLEFDRDVVAFYGDPAWEARMTAGPLNYDQVLTTSVQADGRVQVTLEVTPLRGSESFAPVNTNGSQRGGRPLVAYLPQRLLNLELHAGERHNPLLTDRFLLLPNPGTAWNGDTIRVVVSGQPASSPADRLAP